MSSHDGTFQLAMRSRSTSFAVSSSNAAGTNSGLVVLAAESPSPPRHWLLPGRRFLPRFTFRTSSSGDAFRGQRAAASGVVPPYAAADDDVGVCGRCRVALRQSLRLRIQTRWLLPRRRNLPRPRLPARPRQSLLLRRANRNRGAVRRLPPRSVVPPCRQATLQTVAREISGLVAISIRGQVPPSRRLVSRGFGMVCFVSGPLLFYVPEMRTRRIAFSFHPRTATEREEANRSVSYLIARRRNCKRQR